MKRPLGAQISRMLKARGVEVIFGIPGVHNQELYRGIEEAGVAHVLARHEQGAGFMADGYARATGRPGVAYVITGPGLCNIMTPMGQAFSDSVPLLVISSCLDESAARRGQLHQMRAQETAAACVCEWSHTARSADAAYGLIARAFDEFATLRPRPRHIQVPIARLAAEAPPPPAPPGRVERAREVPEVAPVVDLLRRARRPLFILGGGAVGAADRLRELLARIGAAAFETYAGRGILGAGCALNFGSALPRPSSAEVIGRADLIVAIGTELAEVDLWRDRLGRTAPMVRVDIDPASLSDHEGAEIRLLADAVDFVQALDAATAGMAPASGWAPEEVAAARARWRADSDAERPGIVPLCDALRAAVPADTMIYSDMTQFAYVAKEVWEMDRPGHWHHPTGFGTLGYALPAAIGGAVARRGRGGERGLPTMAIAGDYGFQYSLQELGVAVELGLPLPIILWDNGRLGEIENSMTAAQIAPNAVRARNPDFCRLARAWGAAAAEPSDLADLQRAVQAAFAADRPTLIRLTPAILR